MKWLFALLAISWIIAGHTGKYDHDNAMTLSAIYLVGYAILQRIDRAGSSLTDAK